MSADTAQLIKRVAPYLDTHVLLHFLKNAVPGTERLQEQLVERTLINKRDTWSKGDEEAKANEGNPLLALLNNYQESQKLRQERGFFLEKLGEQYGITLADCKKVFSYAKNQYEMGKYKEAEKYLFALKEILTTEQHSQTEFVLQIFWGLLQCEILLNREKDTLEFTTLTKMKNYIEKLNADQVHSYTESMNHKAWIIHQILIYSFATQKQQPAVSLFAQLFTDKTAGPDKVTPIGPSYLNVIQVKCQYLLRYLISSLILSGNFEFLHEHILPAVIQEKSKFSDVYTRFVETLYEKFDFQAALGLAKELGKAAQDDILLKAHAQELQAHAVLMVFQLKARIYRSVNIKELIDEAATTGFIKTEEEARTRLEESLKKEGFHLEPLDGGPAEARHYYKVLGQSKDAKAKIVSKTIDLVTRTNKLYHNYQ